MCKIAKIKWEIGLEKEENEDLVVSWLKSNSDFYLEKELNIFPLDLKTDGAYVALIRRC